MKHKKAELDVDFIGGERPLTKEEEKALSEYFKAKKRKRTGISRYRRATFSGKKVLA